MSAVKSRTFQRLFLAKERIACVVQQIHGDRWEEERRRRRYEDEGRKKGSRGEKGLEERCELTHVGADLVLLWL